MTMHSPKEQIKIVGSSGQISLGKEYAGRTVLVEEREPGVWHIRTATVIPDNERWLTPEAKQSIARAVDWAKENPASEPTLAESTAQLAALTLLAEEDS
ncbi:hypothetical protein ACFOPQ_13485 [Deinococcus antarcticus]|uniref:Uncharacterized protein n=1 Tax=Deinococcus antarcticus TaxID=1298767 RepID=A0ABV8A7U9_9DEIO